MNTTATTTPDLSRRRIRALVALAEMTREDVDDAPEASTPALLREATIDIVNDALRIAEDAATPDMLRRDLISAARRFMVSPGEWSHRANLSGALADAAATFRRLDS